MKTITLLLLSVICITSGTAQVNEFRCTAPVNKWEFVLQLRADSTFKYEAFSAYGRWDLMLGTYSVKKNKLLLKPVSAAASPDLFISWREEDQFMIKMIYDTLASGEVVRKKIEETRIASVIPVSWHVPSTRPSLFIIKDNRLYEKPKKTWPKMDPYFARTDSAGFDFRKLFR